MAGGRYVAGWELSGRTKVEILRERIGLLVGECVGVKRRAIVMLDEAERFPTEGRNKTETLSSTEYCNKSALRACWYSSLVLAAFESERRGSKAGDRARNQDFSFGSERTECSARSGFT